MPYKIEKRDTKYCVVKVDGGKSMGCHATEKEAKAQMQAIMANEKALVVDNKYLVKLTQAETEYTPASTLPGQACSSCRWYIGERDGGPYCGIISGGPLDIVSNGWCKRWELNPALEEMLSGDDIAQEVEEMNETIPEDEIKELAQAPAETALVETVPNEEKPTALQRLAERVKTALSHDEGVGFKAYGNLWFARWSNNFEDREKETFSQKAIDAYIKRVDLGLVPLPEAWAWHTPGSRFAKAQGVARIGHFVVAWGEFDDTDKGHKARDYYARHKEAVSHGFFYPEHLLRGGVYHHFNTFEISPLPRHAAANAYTSHEVKQMTLSPEKLKHLKQVFGEDIAQQIVADTEKASKSLEEAGIAFKDFADIDQLAETAPVEEAAKEASVNFSGLLSDLIADSAELAQHQALAAKVIKQQNDELNNLKALVEQLQQQVAARPRSAVRDKETEIKPENLSPAAQQTLRDAAVEYDKFWGTEIRKEGI